MVGPGRRQHVDRCATTVPCTPFLQLGLPVEVTEAVDRRGESCRHVALHERERCIGSTIEVHRTEYGFECVGENRVLRRPIGSGLSSSELDAWPEPDVVGCVGERMRVHHALAEVGQPSLGNVSEPMEGDVCNRPAEHRVTEELQPLIAVGVAVLCAP